MSNPRNVQKSAYTRGEGATAGIAAGAWGGMEAVGLATDPYGVALGIVLIPVFATVGGVAGAATGTSRSKEEITRALQTINRAYKPVKFEAAAEREIVKHLRNELFDNGRACLTNRSTRNSCPQGSNSSDLLLSMAFNLVPSESNGAGAGNVDFHGRVTVTTQPAGLVHPHCVTFTYRKFAGNIFDLAKNNGAALDPKLSSAINQFAQQFPEILSANHRSELLNSRQEPDVAKKRNLKLKNQHKGAEWTRTSCAYSPRKTIKADAVQGDPNKPRPPINMGGYGGWPPKASGD